MEPKDREQQAQDRTRGQTTPMQGEKQERAPRMPHERDESARNPGAQEPSGQRMGEIAHDSVERGETDTDKGPVLDATYKKEFRR